MLTYLSKASALVFIPICLGMVELERLWKAGWRPDRTLDTWTPALRSLRDLATVEIGGLVLLFAVCPRASRGLLFQIRHNMDGHGASFLLGEINADGFWYYFPATLAIKLGLPIFMLLLVLVWSGPRYLANGASAAAIGLLLLTPTFRVQIGVRLVLPIAVLALIGAGAACGKWWHEPGSRARHGFLAGIVATSILWSMFGAMQVWPHGICYTNEFWGGTARGYWTLYDSNYDWGQGLPDLAAWQKNHTDAPLNVCYFGTDPDLARLPAQPISMNDLAAPSRFHQVNDGCYLAVSTNYCVAGAIAQQLRNRQPCGRTMTFLIYDLR